MTPDPAGRSIANVVCPFCGLGCNDVAVTIAGPTVRAAVGCAEAESLFQRTSEPVPSPRVNGLDADVGAAAAAAAALLSRSRAPLFAGLGVDIGGARALLDLAGANGGVLDHYASPGLFRSLATTQRRGWIATTLAEVRNRCDLLAVIGADPTGSFGRLFERLFRGEPPLFIAAGAPRAVAFVGGAPGPATTALLSEAGIEILQSGGGDVADLVGGLYAAVKGHRLVGTTIGGATAIALTDIAERLTRSRYATVAWNAGALDPDTAEATIEAACATVDALNRTTRAAVLPLTGRDNIVGVNQLVLWRLGYPLRTAVRGGVAAHDPVLNATERAVEDADLMIWTSAFRPEPPPDFQGDVIALAHPGTSFAAEPAVFIPVGTPGIDHAGHVFRMDAVVALPVVALRRSGLPSVAEAARAIGAASADGAPC